MRSNRNKKNCLRIAILGVLAIPTPGIANGTSMEVISSLCHPDDIQALKCEDDRDCGFKVNALIIDFYKAYEIPRSITIHPLKYPQKCLHRSYKEEAVNLSYTVLPDSKPTDILVLNSTNECFDKAARNHVRKLKFKSSANGYTCMPITLSYGRHALSDSSGNSY